MSADINRIVANSNALRQQQNLHQQNTIPQLNTVTASPCNISMNNSLQNISRHQPIRNSQTGQQSQQHTPHIPFHMQSINQLSPVSETPISNNPNITKIVQTNGTNNNNSIVEYVYNVNSATKNSTPVINSSSTNGFSKIGKFIESWIEEINFS